MANYDIIGNIAIIKPELGGKKQLTKQVKELLKESNIKSVYEKKDKFKGRLRKIKLEYIAGEKSTIARYKENGCVFKLDVSSCYFSPRLSNDRLETAKKIKKNQNVLCLFSGVAPYPIVISKIANPKKIITIEISRECNKYAIENIKMNKCKNVILIKGDVKKIIPRLHEKFDFVVMTRPNLKDNFIKEALIASKKGTKIYFHGFAHESRIEELKKQLIREAEENKRKIKIIKCKKIGDIAPYKSRYGLDIIVV